MRIINHRKKIIGGDIYPRSLFGIKKPMACRKSVINIKFNTLCVTENAPIIADCIKLYQDNSLFDELFGTGVGADHVNFEVNFKELISNTEL